MNICVKVNVITWWNANVCAVICFAALAVDGSQLGAFYTDPSPFVFTMCEAHAGTAALRGEIALGGANVHVGIMM